MGAHKVASNGYHNIRFCGEIRNIFYLDTTLRDAQCTKWALMHPADNVGSDQRAHLCSLIWTFSVCRHILQYSLIL